MDHSGILYTAGTDVDQRLNALPLEEVRAKIQIVDVTTRVTLIQRFFNAAALSTGRAKYCFPVPASAAICAFQMTSSDGRTIKGECKEKEEAREQYELALASGRTAGLLDYVTDDVFVISVGSFPPRTVIETRVVYVMPMLTGDYTDQIQFILPKHVGQRYGAPPSGFQDAYQPCTEARVSITVEIQMHGRIREVISPSHPGVTETKYSTHLGRPSKRRTTIRYKSSNYLESDFLLKILAEGLDKPRCFAEVRRDPQHRFPDTLAMQLTVVPRHKLPPIPSQEYIFLVDRSGSMAGDRIQTASNVLIMMLRMIPPRNSTFNIFGFGSSCESWRPMSQVYSQSTLEDATISVKSLNADLGGTEIRKALNHVFSTCSHHLPTVVFLLTDGEAYDEAACVSEVQQFIKHSNAPRRVFTLGIGQSVSSSMCEGIAKAGNGECLYALDSRSIIQKCAKLFTAGRTPHVRDVSVDWGVVGQQSSPGTPTVGFTSQPSPRTVRTRPPPSIQQAPHTVTSIHSGTRLTIFALISLRDIQVPKSVTLKGTLDDETRAAFQFSVDVHQTSLVNTDSLNIPTVHTMAAWKIVQEHEGGYAPTPQPIGVATIEELRRSAITQLGVQYQIATQYTSFVAIDGVKDTQSGKKLKSSFNSKHQEIEQVDWESDEDQEEQGDPPIGLAEALSTNLVIIASQFSRFLGALFTTIPIMGQYDTPSSDQPPGSWPDQSNNHQDNPNPDTDVPISTDPVSPPSDAGSDSSSIRTFSTLSSLDPYSSGSDWSSLYSSQSSEMEEPPSPRLQPQHGLPQTGKQKARPSSPPPQVVPPVIIELVEFQNADGSFPAHPNIQRLLGLAVFEEAKHLSSQEQAVWTTVCCIAYLKSHLRDNPELLDNLLVKATDFLRSKYNIDVDKLLDRASSLL